VYRPNEKFLYEDNRVGNIEIDATADIHPNAFFEGNVKVGAYCRIDAGVIITGDVTIGDHTVIRCNATLNGNISVGANCHIFDTAAIRGGTPDKPVIAQSYRDGKTIIGDNCIIYHGACVINSTIADGAALGMKATADHGSYIGKGAIIANRTMTYPKANVPDNAFVQGVPMEVKDLCLTDAKRAEYLGFVPRVWIASMSDKLERMHRDNIRLADRINSTKITIGKNTFVHPTAILEGNVTIGDNSRVGPGTIVIGDVNIGSYINICVNNVLKGNLIISDHTHIYDNTVVDSSRMPDIDIFVKKEDTATVGKYCWINHGCMMRGSNFEDSVGMGINSCTDYGTIIGRKTILTNCSATERNAHIAPHAFVIGVPAKIRHYGVTDQDRQNYYGLVPEIWLDVIKEDYEAPFTNQEEENHIASTVTAGKHVFIHPKAWVENNTALGDYVYIDAGSILTEGAKSVGNYVTVGCNTALRGNMTFEGFTYFFDQINVEGGRAGGCRGTNTSEAPDPSIFGEGSIIKPGAVMHGTRLGKGGIMGAGSAGDYNTQMLWGVILANGSCCNVSQYTLPDILIEGLPAKLQRYCLRDEDRMEALGIRKDEFVLLNAELRHSIAKSKPQIQ